MSVKYEVVPLDAKQSSFFSPLSPKKKLQLKCFFFFFWLVQEKKIGQLKKYPNQPMTGFRYVGMSWWSHAKGDEQAEKVSKGKEWGAEMDVEDCGYGLAK